MYKIAFDLNGLECPIDVPIETIKAFLKLNPNYHFYLIGEKQAITNIVQENSHITIINAKELKVSKPRTIRHYLNDDNSMTKMIHLLRDKKIDAAISGGNSTYYISLATLLIKRISGVSRPAFMTIFPTINQDQKFVFLDAGANLKTNSKMLVEWAKIGSLFAKYFLNIDSPKVAIANVGVEDEKGFDFHHEAHQELKNLSEINYFGFIEPRYLLNGEIDVLVTDGYAGNMILKSMEGTSKAIGVVLKKQLYSKMQYRIGALLAKRAIMKTKDILDYRNIGGAWIIGLEGLLMKTHGASNKKSIMGALNLLKTGIESLFMDKVKKYVNK